MINTFVEKGYRENGGPDTRKTIGKTDKSRKKCTNDEKRGTNDGKDRQTMEKTGRQWTR